MRCFESLTSLSSEEFLRDVGMTLEQFLTVRDQVVAAMIAERVRAPIKNRGKQTSRLTVEDKLLLTLTYVRHYPTFQQLGSQFGISESYAHKLYERYRGYLVQIRRLPGHRALLNPELTAILIDVTEQPIERPRRRQRIYYSGKKRRHTIKAQLVVCLFTLQILSVVCGPGQIHDFALLKHAHLRIAARIDKYADAGYQGLSKWYRNSLTPIKKPKHRNLTPDERAYNRALARVRIHIEHVNRRCKIFRIVKETYRGKHRHVQITWTLVAVLVNLRYAE
jgi:hypothetical protein